METVIVRDPAGGTGFVWAGLPEHDQRGSADAAQGALYLLSATGELRRVRPIPPHWANGGHWLWRLCQRFGERVTPRNRFVPGQAARG